IATGIEQEEWTDEAHRLLAGIKPSDLQKRDIWKLLTTLVQVEPDEDVFPIRAPYGGSSRTIGLNALSAEFGLWYTLADCVASKLKTGSAPRIVRAIRFIPKQPQPGLKPIDIGGNPGFHIDPYKDDFYRRVIELRGQVQAEEKQARAEGRTEDAE